MLPTADWQAFKTHYAAGLMPGLSLVPDLLSPGLRLQQARGSALQMDLNRLQPGLPTVPDDSLQRYCQQLTDLLRQVSADNVTLIGAIRRFTALYRLVSQFDYMSFIDKEVDKQGRREVRVRAMLQALRDTLLKPGADGKPAVWLASFARPEVARAAAEKMFGADWRNMVEISEGAMRLRLDPPASLGILLHEINQLDPLAAGAPDNTGRKVTIDTPRFSAWQNRYSLGVTHLQHDNQSLLTALGRDTASLDTLLKLFMSAIDRLYEAARAFLRF